MFRISFICHAVVHGYVNESQWANAHTNNEWLGVNGSALAQIKLEGPTPINIEDNPNTLQTTNPDLGVKLKNFQMASLAPNQYMAPYWLGIGSFHPQILNHYLPVTGWTSYTDHRGIQYGDNINGASMVYMQLLQFTGQLIRVAGLARHSLPAGHFQTILNIVVTEK